MTTNKLDNLNLEFTFNEKIPKELEGKTLSEVFDMVRIRTNEIIKLLKENTNNIDNLTLDDQMYLRLAQMFKDMARGDLSSLKGIGSQYNQFTV